MQWIAPSEKDTASASLERRPWNAAEGAGSAPHFAETDFNGDRQQGHLGIISLRFAEVRFDAKREKLEKTDASSRPGNRVDESAVGHAEGMLHLAPSARFDFLLNLPGAKHIGAKVNDARRVVAKCEVPVGNSVSSTFDTPPFPTTVDYKAFGRIHECFLGEFTMDDSPTTGKFVVRPHTPQSRSLCVRF